MSGPEARLSAAERAALADLETAAAAADPHFAARLRGRAPARALPFLISARAWAVARWEWTLDRGWWSIPATIIGLALVVLGIPYGVAVALVGLIVSVVGLRVMAEMVDRKWFGSDRSRSGSAPEA